jgi:hypothetical protein
LAGWEDISLTEETPDGKTVSGVNRDALPGLLADRFGLPGFSIGADGGLRLQR